MTEPFDPTLALQMLSLHLDARLIRRGLEDIPYLWRAYLGERQGEGKTEVGAFLHKFVASDNTDLHGHPWRWAVSFILDGEYDEDRVDDVEINVSAVDGRKFVTLREHKALKMRYGPGSRNIILNNTFHRVDLRTPEVWTLFIHGPRASDWGFVRAAEPGEHPSGSSYSNFPAFGRPLLMRVMEGHTRDRLPREVVR